jgi:protein involved in temperature-dependent protein secretion
MVEAFTAAMSHPFPSARLQSIYGDYAWNVLHDKSLGIQMTAQAVQEDPGEPAYRITLVRMLIDRGNMNKARQNIDTLQQLDVGGRLTGDIAGLLKMQAARQASSPAGGHDAAAERSQTPRK